MKTTIFFKCVRMRIVCTKFLWIRYLKVWRAVANTFLMHYKGSPVNLNMRISLNTPFINRIADQERLRTWTMVFRSDHVLVKIHKLKLTRQNTYILSEAYQKCKKKACNLNLLHTRATHSGQPSKKKKTWF